MCDRDRFTRWFANPVAKLKELPNGDGGFAALMIALPLYERFLAARLEMTGGPARKQAIRGEMAKDLCLTRQQVEMFLKVFRHGFMHRGMGQPKEANWMTSCEFTAKPEFRVYDGKTCICLDPWKFADRVLKEFFNCPSLIDGCKDSPLARIFPI